MSNLTTRLARIEGQLLPPPPKPTRASHLLGGTNAECEAQREALVDSGNAAESDLFIFLIPVVPATRPAP